MPDIVKKSKSSEKANFTELLENVSELFSADELEQIRLAYDQMASMGKQKARLLRPIIPIRQWLNDPYYVGPDAENIYPFWKEHIAAIFESKERINQVILTGAIGCLKTDTLYATSEGFKTIGQLSSSFSVLSEETNENAIASSAHILGIKPTKLVELTNGTKLEGTYNHKIKVLDKNKIVWKRFDELNIGDKVIHHRKKELFSNKEYDEDLAYMIGYILGDGYSTDANNKYLISIALQKDQSNYNRLYNLFERYFGTPSISLKNGKTANFRKTSNSFKDLEFWSAINNRSHDKYIPEYLLSYNEKAIASILRGLFDTDGSASEASANIEYGSVSEKLTYQVKRLLAAYGINSRVVKRKSSYNKIKTFDSYRLTINGIENLKLFNKYIGFEIDYKKSILESIISKDNSNQRTPMPGVLEVLKEHNENIHCKSSRIHSHATSVLKNNVNKNITERTFNYFKEHFYDWLSQNETLKYIADNNVYIEEVKSINDSIAEVGDIEVPKTHCYNLGGIVSHNTGKSTTAVLIILRVIYELSCYEHISALFNLFGVSRIAFAYLSVTKEQAQNTGFALLIEWLDSIPYFREKFKRRQGIDSIAIWPEERLIVTFGSVANHFIGMNLIGSILDEANFFSGRSKEDSDYTMNSKVASLYTQIIARAESRFIVNGINYSMSILVSSSTVASSFTEERIEKAKGDPHTYIISPALWEVKPWNYKGKNFFVFVGGDNLDPFVIRDLEDINSILTLKSLKTLQGMTVHEAYEVLPHDIKRRIIQVPEEHKQSFQGDIIIALQDIAGYSVSAANKLFSSQAAYQRCLTDARHPFSHQEIILSTTNEALQDGFLPIKSYLYNGWKFEKLNMKRYMHLDLALTGDSLGISMCYISGWKSIYKQPSNYDPDKTKYNTGLVEDEIKIPIIEYDFMLKVNPPKKPNKISLSKVRDFIVFLRNELGIKFEIITADQFQSAQLLQELGELGFNTGSLSVDRTPDAYLSFTNLIYEERVKFYDYPPFKQELFNVMYYPAKKKVDHTAAGCFVGSQKIFLLSGEDVEIKDLVGMEDFWVLSSREDGEIVPAKGYNARETKKVHKTLKITLDNNEIIECTHEHPIMLRNGIYVLAKDLKAGDSLMPLYKKECIIEYTKGSANYLQVKDNKTGRYSWLHRLVVRKTGRTLNKTDIVHHYDFNPLNNNPNNLVVMDRSSHAKLHAEIAKLGSTEENVEKRIAALKKNNRLSAGVDPDSKLTPREQMLLTGNIDYDYVINSSLISLEKLEKAILKINNKKTNPEMFDSAGKLLPKYSLSEEDYLKFLQSRKINAQKLNEEYWNSKEGIKRKIELYESRKKTLRNNVKVRVEKTDKEWLARFDSSKKYRSIAEIMKIYGGGRKQVERRLNSIDYKLDEYNHKVKSIIEVVYADPIPVYDISVEGTSNFALSAGVIVHNSKDIADSVVGAAFNAIKSLDKTDINEQSLTDMFVFANSNGEEQYKEAVKSALDNLMNILKNS